MGQRAWQARPVLTRIPPQHPAVGVDGSKHGRVQLAGRRAHRCMFNPTWSISDPCLCARSSSACRELLRVTGGRRGPTPRGVGGGGGDEVSLEYISTRRQYSQVRPTLLLVCGGVYTPGVVVLAPRPGSTSSGAPHGRPAPGP